MENLSIQDDAAAVQQQQHQQGPAGVLPMPGPGSGPGPVAGLQGPPQLPPQMFTTAAQLLDLTDKKLLLVLRDGRKLHGVLRSWDQFANLVLADTRERYFVSTPTGNNLYCDVARGTYLVRGENVLVLGEVDLDRDDEPPVGYEEGDVEEVFRLQKEAEQTRKTNDKVRSKKEMSVYTVLAWHGNSNGMAMRWYGPVRETKNRKIDPPAQTDEPTFKKRAEYC